jgi:hypothetical protein
MNPEQLLQVLLQLLTDATYIPAAGLGIVAFTNVIKFVLTKVGFTLPDMAQVIIALVVQFIVWSAWMLFTRLGLIDQFTQWYDAAVTVVMALFPLLGGTFAAHKIYQASKAQPATVSGVIGAQTVEVGGSGAVPILGYSVPKKKEMRRYSD